MGNLFCQYFALGFFLPGRSTSSDGLALTRISYFQSTKPQTYSTAHVTFPWDYLPQQSLNPFLYFHWIYYRLGLISLCHFFFGLYPNFENNFFKPASVATCLPVVSHERHYPTPFLVPGTISRSQISAINAELHPA